MLKTTWIFFLQICRFEGVDITDPDNRDNEDASSKHLDQAYIDCVAKLIKARFPGVKPQPSIIETCLYTVSYRRNIIYYRDLRMYCKLQKEYNVW